MIKNDDECRIKGKSEINTMTTKGKKREKLYVNRRKNDNKE